MSVFSVGQHVRSRVDAQGLRVGRRYVVIDVQTRHTFVGGFTTYVLENGDERLSVGNGHLILESAQ